VSPHYGAVLAWFFGHPRSILEVAHHLQYSSESRTRSRSPGIGQCDVLPEAALHWDNFPRAKRRSFQERFKLLNFGLPSLSDGTMVPEAAGPFFRSFPSPSTKR